MSQRETAVTRVIEYETAECVHCGDDVFVDDTKENIENLPEAVNVIIGGGKNISVHKSNKPRADYRIPKIVTKLFTNDNTKTVLERQHMCPSCAESVYGFGSD